MTNELEKQFFDTFGIEPIGCNDNKNCTGVLDCTQCPNAKYPQITDRILLELITIHSCWCLPRLCCFNVEQLKEQVLSDLTLFNDERIELIHQVRTLFEEER
jgi:hypothetical protein